MAVRKVRLYGWSDVLQSYIPLPLDEADKWTIEVARRIAGRDITDEEYKRVIADVMSTEWDQDLSDGMDKYSNGG